MAILYLPLAILKFSGEFKKNGKLIYHGLSLVLLASLVYSFLYVFLHLKQLSSESSYGLNSFFDHRNILGAFTVLSLNIVTFLCYSLELIESKFSRIVLYLNWVLASILLINLHSLASWLGFSFLVAASTVNFIKRRDYALLTIVVLSILLGWTYKSEIVDTKSVNVSMDSREMQSNNDRLNLFEKTLDMFIKHPVLGVGSGKWVVEAGESGWSETEFSDGVTFATRPHNDWLWIFSEFGLIGGVMYLSLFILSFVNLIIKLRRNFEIHDLLLISGFVSIILYMSVSFPSERYSLLLCMALVLSLTLSNEPDSAEKSKSIKYLTNGVSFLGILLFMLIARVDYLSSIIINSRQNGELKTAFREIENLKSLGLTYDRFGVPIVWYQGSVFLDQNEQADAMQCFLESADVSPNIALIYNDLAVVSVMQNLSNKQIENYFYKSLELCPDFQEARLNFATYFFINNQYENMTYQLEYVVDNKYLDKKEELLKLTPL